MAIGDEHKLTQAQRVAVQGMIDVAIRKNNMLRAEIFDAAGPADAAEAEHAVIDTDDTTAPPETDGAAEPETTPEETAETARG